MYDKDYISQVSEVEEASPSMNPGSASGKSMKSKVSRINSEEKKSISRGRNDSDKIFVMDKQADQELRQFASADPQRPVSQEKSQFSRAK